jgi:hypothetical protein
MVSMCIFDLAEDRERSQHLPRWWHFVVEILSDVVRKETRADGTLDGSNFKEVVEYLKEEFGDMPAAEVPDDMREAIMSGLSHADEANIKGAEGMKMII